jgi:hypothetical protein
MMIRLCIIVAGLTLLSAAAPVPAAAPPLGDAGGLPRLAGRWSCAGAFIRSGKPIKAIIAARYDQAAAALVVHHDDVSPGTYHSIELWTPPAGTARHAAVIADAFSGIRSFTAPGWTDDTLVWTRAAADGAVIETFGYRLTGARTMRVEWHVSRAGKPLELGDWLECRRLDG